MTLLSVVLFLTCCLKGNVENHVRLPLSVLSQHIEVNLGDFSLNFFAGFQGL